MGFTPFLEKIVEILAKIEFLIPQEKIRSDYWKARRHRWLLIFKKNDVNEDLKRGIYGCFLWAYRIDTLLLVLIIFANIFYVALYFSPQSDFDFKVSWIGILIINLLYPFFFIRYFRDIYKISLRGKYRRNYLKLWWIDFVTLNILSLIGSWLVLSDKSQTNNPVKTQVKFYGNLRSQIDISRFYKFVSKIELIIFVILGSLLLGSLAISFINVETKGIKWLFLVIYAPIFLEFNFSLQKVLGLIILKKVLKDLSFDQSHDLLITSIRLLWYIFDYVYVSAFLNVLGFDETDKDFIFERR